MQLKMTTYSSLSSRHTPGKIPFVSGKLKEIVASSSLLQLQ